MTTTGWLETIGFFFSRTVLWRPEVQNQGVSRVSLPPKVLGENPSVPLPASSRPRGSLARGSTPPVSASLSSRGRLPVCLCPFLSLTRTLIGRRTRLQPVSAHLDSTLITAAKTLFPNKVTS